MRARRSRAALRAGGLLAAALLTAVLAQPYAADGGFDRPRALALDQERPLFALALDRGRATLALWSDGALRVAALDGGAADEIAVEGGLRALAAHGGPAAPAVVVWSRRDLTSGRYPIAATLGDLRLESAQLLPLVPLSTPTGALLLTQRGGPDGARIERIDAPTPPLYGTELQIAALSADAADGFVHLTWLEGFTESTAFGAQSVWTARAARWEADGRLSGPVDLGAADGTSRTTTAVGAGAVVRAWTGADGTVRSAAGRGDDPAVADADRVVAHVPGRPIGATPLPDGGAHIFVARGDAIWRVGGDGPPTAVAWSPVVIAEAAALHDAAGHHHLVWSGTTVGGRGAVYASDDRRPLQRGWRDVIAAAFGWRPWSLAEEAWGQLAGSLLAALLATTSLLPLLGLTALVTVRGRDPGRARWLGAGFGAALPAVGAAAAALAGVAPTQLAPLVGGWATLTVATPAAALVASGLWRRADLEATPAFVAAAATALAVAAAVSAFAGFQAWLALGWW
jgi:hypothetical protein